MRSGKIGCLLIVTALGTILVLAGCGSSSSYMPPATSVTVTPTTAAVYRGETVQFAALVSGPSNKTVTWSVPSGLGSIDSTALYTASSDFGGGAIDVPATSNAVPRTSGTASAADNWRSQEREDNHPTLRSTLHQAGGHTSGPLAKVVL